MKRRKAHPRNHWQSIVESQGLTYHTLKGENREFPYWDESAYYTFSATEIDELETCTEWLNDACLQACEFIIEQDLFPCVGIPPSHVDWVKRSWERDEHTILGRFDLWYNGQEPPKLLEFNADTPTSLVEASVIQWFWMRDLHAGNDQFNSIHEKILEIFQILKRKESGIFHFTGLADNQEDFMNVHYLMDLAIQAGWSIKFLPIKKLGWNPQKCSFMDLEELPINNIFKLYPWEWMIREPFGQHLLLDTTRWWEPPWKSMLSNKGLLPILFQLFPESPYILPASFENPVDNANGDSFTRGNYMKKPLHGREGANMDLVVDHSQMEKTGGPYGGPFVYQEAKVLPCFDGYYPVLGSWLVNGHACGIGIREDSQPITGNTSRFVPHIF